LQCLNIFATLACANTNGYNKLLTDKSERTIQFCYVVNLSDSHYVTFAFILHFIWSVNPSFR